MKEKKSIKTIMEEEFNMNFYEIFHMLLLIMVLSAIFGFIYEMIFYRIDLGYFTKRGTTFGPWIPIYGFGGLFIILITYHFRRKPLLVFLLSCIISGILEFTTGYLLFHISGIRLWDYNVEIWNFGNIGGYICLRSILFFGVSGLLLIYLFKPLVDKIYKKINKNVFNCISIILASIFFIDIIISTIL